MSRKDVSFKVFLSYNCLCLFKFLYSFCCFCVFIYVVFSFCFFSVCFLKLENSSLQCGRRRNGFRHRVCTHIYKLTFSVQQLWGNGLTHFDYIYSSYPLLALKKMGNCYRNMNIVTVYISRDLSLDNDFVFVKILIVTHIKPFLF